MKLMSRNSRWAPGGLQRKIVLTTLTVGAVFVLFHAQFTFFGLLLISKNTALTRQELLSAVTDYLWIQIVVASLATGLLGLDPCLAPTRSSRGTAAHS